MYYACLAAVAFWVGIALLLLNPPLLSLLAALVVALLALRVVSSNPDWPLY